MVQSEVLIKKWEPLIYKIVVQYMRRHPALLSHKEDLLQEAKVALIKNKSRYENKPDSHIFVEIRDDIIDAVRGFAVKLLGIRTASYAAKSFPVSIHAESEEEETYIDFLVGYEDVLHKNFEKKDLFEKLKAAGSRILTGAQYQAVFESGKDWGRSGSWVTGIRKLKDYVERNWK